MSNAYLELSINGLTVRLERFLNGALPRIDAEVGNTSVNYTAAGSVVVQGASFESFALWNVEAPVSVTAFQTLKLIYLESEYQRRNNGNPNILITDTTQPHQERGARTRAIAPGTTVINRAPYLLYYAQYFALMPRQPEWEILGNGYRARFTLLETTRTVP